MPTRVGFVGADDHAALERAVDREVLDRHVADAIDRDDAVDVAAVRRRHAVRNQRVGSLDDDAGLALAEDREAALGAADRHLLDVGAVAHVDDVVGVRRVDGALDAAVRALQRAGAGIGIIRREHQHVGIEVDRAVGELQQLDAVRRVVAVGARDRDVDAVAAGRLAGGERDDGVGRIAREHSPVGGAGIGRVAAAVDRVVAAVAGDRIVAVAADQRVAGSAALQRVGSTGAVEHHPHRGAGHAGRIEGVVAAVAGDAQRRARDAGAGKIAGHDDVVAAAIGGDDDLFDFDGARSRSWRRWHRRRHCRLRY